MMALSAHQTASCSLPNHLMIWWVNLILVSKPCHRPVPWVRHDIKHPNKHHSSLTLMVDGSAILNPYFDSTKSSCLQLNQSSKILLFAWYPTINIHPSWNKCLDDDFRVSFSLSLSPSVSFSCRKRKHHVAWFTTRIGQVGKSQPESVDFYHQI